MSNGSVIRLLPDSVANQIAAGEVVQRPSSVVKELMENAVDAGATEIKVVITDSGRTAIQIIDNGCGMEMTDARLAFERHATSKIVKAEDLFALQTFGFRGEALPSIAAVAEVELRTGRAEDELGTLLIIRGSEIVKQTHISKCVGTNITIKNLFFNIPVRRKFLKSDGVEFSNILNEFERVVLCYPQIAFGLYHNQKTLYDLPAASARQRIADLYGKNRVLVPLEVETGFVKIEGFIGNPQSAKKRKGEQFFFVNRRFFKHTYFENAVCKAYEKLIPENTYPSFFLYIEVESHRIDVNIHPTKTEIKFEDEQLIWQSLHAGVRESLGKAAFVPYLDFDNVHNIQMNAKPSSNNISMPEFTVNPQYNPFEEKEDIDFPSNFGQNGVYQSSIPVSQGNDHAPSLFGNLAVSEKKIFQLNSKFIVTTLTSGLLLIHQHRAHSRILYDKLKTQQNIGQHSIAQIHSPQISVTPHVYHLLLQNIPLLQDLGIVITDGGNEQIQIITLPVEIRNVQLEDFLSAIADELENGNLQTLEDYKDGIFRRTATQLAVKSGEILPLQMMNAIVEELLQCSSPDVCPYGKKTFELLSLTEIQSKFNL